MNLALLIAVLVIAVTVAAVLAHRDWIRRAEQRGSSLLATPEPGERFTLGGRTFHRAPTTTVRQDEYFVELLRGAGMMQPELLAGETPTAYVERIYCELHQRHLLAPMLSCVLLPEGAPAWNEEVERAAPEVACFLGDLDDPRDKRLYNALLGDLLRPFCMTGLPSWSRSRASGRPSPTNPSASPASSPAPAPVTGGV